MFRKNIFLCSMLLAAGIISVKAEEVPKPEIQSTKSGSVLINNISDNGKWGVITLDGENDGNILPGGSVLVDLTTMKETVLKDDSYSGANDVTDDGNIVVGTIGGLPGYYNVAEGKWTKLSLPKSLNTGYLSGVTADGRYAVGAASPASNPYVQVPVYYDLTTGEQLELKGLPMLDMTHENQDQMTFNRISSDGKYALGVMSFSYIQPASLCTFVYDLENHSYKMIGFEENDTKPWKAKAEGLHFIDAANMSPNGRYVTGQAYMVKDIPGSQFANEYIVGFRYDVEKDEIEVYDGQYDADVAGINVTNDGVVIGTTPAINPYSETMIRRDGYWYSLRTVFEKIYGIDIELKANVPTTGKTVAMSADGLTTVQLSGTRDCYVLKMKESFLDASKRIKILGKPEVTPADNSSFAQISQVKLTFDRKVELAKEAKSVVLNKGNDQLASGINAYVDGNDVNIVFRTRALDKGVNYTVEIPENFVTLVGDANQGNDPITLHYKGRGTDSVKITDVLPADGASFAYIDAMSNPLLFTFDTQIKVADNAVFYLYEDGVEEPMADLQLLASGDQIIAYPLYTQQLFKDVEYTVKVPAGVVTDLTGIGPNEEFTVHYTGNFVREVNATEKYIFYDNCDNRYNYMLFDGDELTPCEDMTYWTFTNTTPWVEVRESTETTDMALCSHSMYDPVGKSDDWLVTPQLYIPDDICYLQFQSQSYLYDLEDRLKVYVYPCETIYHKLNAEIVEDIRTNGVLVYDKAQDAGSSEEELTGDWMDNVVDLSQFAEKHIYIAFLNDNEDLSAVFIDNVRVVHDVPYSVAFSNQESVVGADKIQIKGLVKVESEVELYSDIELTLLDEAGNVISQITDSGLDLGQGDVYEFAFPKELPLKVGSVNKFTVNVKLGEDFIPVTSSVKNLVFVADKNVVVEEFTGTTCPNCPRGIVAMENLQKYYPGRIIPVALHTYSGDRLNSGMDAYAMFLGMNAAPSGRVNRGSVSEPMTVANGEYRISGAGLIDESGADVKTWFDLATDELNKPADAKVDFRAEYDPATQTITIPGNVTFSLGYDNRNVNIFTVVLENNVEAFQLNNHYSLNMPVLGEWGSGGKYAQATVNPYTHNHVARGVLSTLYSGTPGLIPSTIVAGTPYEFTLTAKMPITVDNPANTSIVVMILDNDTGEFINAAEAHMDDPNGSGAVENIAGDSKAVYVYSDNGAVHVMANGKMTVDLFTIDGAHIANGTGVDHVGFDMLNRSGIVLVKVTTASGSKIAKVML